ncbi:DUF3048 domain-containing protein [Anaerofustis sp. LCP19S3_F7]|uniref:DUF3048 domain-containing protein n=1 Tax=Anaerofustis sp. LCP19S3_F7 TaxID=3440247 RepID=UPI003F8DCF27
MNKKLIAIITCIFLVLGTFYGCGKEETAEVKVDVNPLTGLEGISKEAVGKRPIAVMVNNHKEALPQYGIGDADIIFEIPVEGNITRLMAIYGDYTKVPSVCPIRSCRYYFPIFADSFDSIYIHWGGNDYATNTLNSLGIDRFDGMTYGTDLFDRDQDRLNSGYALEHTGYLKGENIPEVIKKENIRIDLKEEKNKPIFAFEPIVEEEAVEEEPGFFEKLFGGKEKEETKEVIETTKLTACNKATLNFSNEYYSTFTFDSESKTYKKQHSGKEQVDGKTNEQLAFTNVFVLETDIGMLGIGELKEVDWKGGSGYYLSNGRVQEIKWSKDSEEGDLKITTLEGNELPVYEGKSYIGVIQKDKTDFELNKEDIQTREIYSPEPQAAQ